MRRTLLLFSEHLQPVDWFQNEYWGKSCKQRVTELRENTTPNRNMVSHYTSLTVAY